MNDEKIHGREFQLDPNNPLEGITEEVIEAYERDGVVMLRGALSAEWLMLIEVGLN